MIRTKGCNFTNWQVGEKYFCTAGINLSHVTKKKKKKVNQQHTIQLGWYLNQMTQLTLLSCTWLDIPSSQTSAAFHQILKLRLRMITVTVPYTSTPLFIHTNHYMAVSWLTVEQARLPDATSPRAAAVATALTLVSCSGIRQIYHGNRETEGGKHKRRRDVWTEGLR